MKKTAKQWIEYYQQAINHMKNTGIAFCFSESGEMLTVGGCKRQIKLFKE